MTHFNNVEIKKFFVQCIECKGSNIYFQGDYSVDTSMEGEKELTFVMEIVCNDCGETHFQRKELLSDDPNEKWQINEN